MFSKEKIKRFFVLVLSAAAFPLYAADMPGERTDLADTIKEVISGPFVRTLLIIFLCASAVAYAFNKDNEKVKRNCIAIGVSAAIIIAAGGILEALGMGG
jgi:hypothetical protein